MSNRHALSRRHCAAQSDRVSAKFTHAELLPLTQRVRPFPYPQNRIIFPKLWEHF